MLLSAALVCVLAALIVADTELAGARDPVVARASLWILGVVAVTLLCGAIVRERQEASHAANRGSA